MGKKKKKLCYSVVVIPLLLVHLKPGCKADAFPHLGTRWNTLATLVHLKPGCKADAFPHLVVNQVRLF